MLDRKLNMRSEKEKMLSGELYLSADEELVTGRKIARKLTRTFNSTTEDEVEKRFNVLKELLGSIGGKIEIEPPFYCDYGKNIYVGENLYANFGCVLLDCNKIEIGNNVKLGPHVQIYTAYHPTNPILRNSGKELAAPISIGNNVWIGGNTVICPGVTIGDNTTIGAGSVVVKNIPANSIAVGNPCKVIKSVV